MGAEVALKVGLVGGQIDVVAHDEPGARIEVHSVTVKDLRIEVTGDGAEGSIVEIDHPQLRWDNFLEVFRNFGDRYRAKQLYRYYLAARILVHKRVHGKSAPERTEAAQQRYRATWR